MTLSRHPSLLDRKHTALIIVDMQERFRPVIDHYDQLAANIVKLIKGIRTLDVPVFYTEQYPQGLGRTDAVLAEHLAGCRLFEKMRFSIAADELLDAMREHDVRQCLLCGIETHVCILQSALDLDHRGFQVHIPFDAVASRHPAHRVHALERLRLNGITVTNVESALFELVETSGTDEFKAVSRLIK